MARKLTYRYHMEPDSRSHVAFSAFMGGAFFLRAAYYFGFSRPEEAGFWSLLIFLILPALLECGYMVMVRGLRLDLPGVYGIMGAAYFALMLLQSFQTGGVLRIVLAIPAYLCCAAAMVGIGWGLLSKSLANAVLVITLAVRVLAFDLSGYVLKFRVIPFIREAAALCGIIGMICFITGLKDKKRK